MRGRQNTEWGSSFARGYGGQAERFLATDFTDGHCSFCCFLDAVPARRDFALLKISQITLIYLPAWRTCRELSLVRAPRKLTSASAGAFSILLTCEASENSSVQFWIGHRGKAQSFLDAVPARPRGIGISQSSRFRFAQFWGIFIDNFIDGSNTKG